MLPIRAAGVIVCELRVAQETIRIKSGSVGIDLVVEMQSCHPEYDGATLGYEHSLVIVI